MTDRFKLSNKILRNNSNLRENLLEVEHPSDMSLFSYSNYMYSYYKIQELRAERLRLKVELMNTDYKSYKEWLIE
jgi:hypothetical protein